MGDAKKQSSQHLIDRRGQQLLQSILPDTWILREYRPDYGLDYALELFQTISTTNTRHKNYETLGEHIFIQLKSVVKPVVKPLKVYGRYNVEKGPEKLNRKDVIGTIKTSRIQIDTQELVTIDRMGVGVPVLLVLADLTKNQCTFVCLNDYIDKILKPRFPNYASNSFRTIHIPANNQIGTELGQSGLRWYGKRAKLYSAFQRFKFQEHELQYADHNVAKRKLAEYFASRIIGYDFWEDTEMWAIISWMHSALQNFQKTGRSGLIPNAEVLGGERQQWAIDQDMIELWRQLGLLPTTYEDICREWFLPTGCGITSTFVV